MTLDELINKVEGGRYGTKNRSELLSALYALKDPMTTPKLSEEGRVRRTILFMDIQKDGSATVSMKQVDEVIEGLLADQKQELAREIEGMLNTYEQAMKEYNPPSMRWAKANQITPSDVLREVLNLLNSQSIQTQELEQPQKSDDSQDD